MQLYWLAWDTHQTLCNCMWHRCRYDGLEIVEQREVGLPDSVHSMQLAGNFAYVGLRQVKQHKLPWYWCLHASIWVQ